MSLYAPRSTLRKPAYVFARCRRLCRRGAALPAPRRLGERGQFIPITAMVTFTSVVFMVAVFNVYTVAKAKLKVQNLADAVALNIASQMASSMNKVADLNQWMNNMIDQGPSGTQPKPGDIPDCVHVNPSLPPLSCAENATKDKNLNTFDQKGDAAGYAGLVHRINLSQQMFIDAYNNFIGAGAQSNSSASTNSSARSILLGDIPELNDPGTSVIIWNDQSAQAKAQVVMNSAAQNAQQHTLDTNGMQKLNFKINDITVAFKTTLPIINAPGPLGSQSLGQLLTGKKQAPPVGWMEPDAGPTINIKMAKGTKSRVGAGAIVTRSVKVMGRTISVSAEAQAFIVEDSGLMEKVDDPAHPGVKRPVFRPTYWVKLAGS